MIMCFPVSAAYVMPCLPRPDPVFEYGEEVDRILPDEVINIVCQYYKVDRSFIFRRKRTTDIITVRQMCEYMMKMYCRITLVEIGKLFGQDHTTVIHHCRYITGQLSAKGSNHTKNEVADILKLLPKKRIK